MNPIAQYLWCMKPILHLLRVVLGSALIFAGSGHLTFARSEFVAQVPPWLPLEADFVVVASGFAELALGLGLLLSRKYRQHFGLATALFFVAIFWGNLAQYFEQRDAFGLNTDEARAIRLFFQPILVIWALASTSALQLLRKRR